jgi:hypothetical protein
MQKNLVYHKSAKGTEAIATRQHGLGPKLRSMLIMVDGKRGFDELARLAQMLGDTEELLGQLLEQGLIEPVAAPAAPPPHAGGAGSATTAPAPLAAAAPITLAEAQRFVSRRLTDLLGPNAEDLCLRIEGARNVHDFQVAVSRAEGILRQYKSAHTAAEFAAEVQAHMPGR